MNRKLIYAILGLLVLAGALVWYSNGFDWYKRDADAEPITRVAGSGKTQPGTPANPSSQHSPPSTDEQQESYTPPAKIHPPTPRQLAQAAAYSDYETALAIIKQGIAADVPGAWDAWRQLNIICRMVANDDSTNTFSGPEFATSEIKQRCQGFTMPANEFWRKAHRNSSHTAIPERLKRIARKEGTVAAARTVERIMATSENPYAVQGVQIYLATASFDSGDPVRVHLRITEDLFRTPNPELVLTAMMFAGMVMHCRRGGNCAPNSLKTLDKCKYFWFCERDTTFPELWFATVPAIVKEASFEIVSRLEGLADGTWPAEDFDAHSENKKKRVYPSKLFINDEEACGWLAGEIAIGHLTRERATFEPAFEIGEAALPDMEITYSEYRDFATPVCTAPDWYRRCFVAHSSSLDTARFASLPVSRGTIRPIHVTYPNGGTETFRLLGPILLHNPARYLLPVAGTRNCPNPDTSERIGE